MGKMLFTAEAQRTQTKSRTDGRTEPPMNADQKEDGNLIERNRIRIRTPIRFLPESAFIGVHRRFHSVSIRFLSAPSASPRLRSASVVFQRCRVNLQAVFVNASIDK